MWKYYCLNTFGLALSSIFRSLHSSCKACSWIREPAPEIFSAILFEGVDGTQQIHPLTEPMSHSMCDLPFAKADSSPSTIALSADMFNKLRLTSSPEADLHEESNSVLVLFPFSIKIGWSITTTSRHISIVVQPLLPCSSLLWRATPPSLITKNETGACVRWVECRRLGAKRGARIISFSSPQMVALKLGCMP